MAARLVAATGGGGGGATGGGNGGTGGAGAGAAGGAAASNATKGLVNVNIAPRDVLLTLPGLEDADVDKLISARQGQTAGDASVGWVAEALDRKSIGLGKYITGKTSQYSADILAVSGNGRAFKHCRIVVNTSGSTPQIVYRRDLTERGWPMDPQILAQLRSGERRQHGRPRTARREASTDDPAFFQFPRNLTGRRRLSCAELSVSGGKRVVPRLATFIPPGDFSFEKPEAAGAALAAFLRSNKFPDSRAVIGIPAKWMIAVEKELPPAAEEQGRAMLRLQAERLGVSDSGDMVFDYVGDISADQPNKVLLVGLLRHALKPSKKCSKPPVSASPPSPPPP